MTGREGWGRVERVAIELLHARNCFETSGAFAIVLSARDLLEAVGDSLLPVAVLDADAQREDVDDALRRSALVSQCILSADPEARFCALRDGLRWLVCVHRFDPVAAAEELDGAYVQLRQVPGAVAGARYGIDRVIALLWRVRECEEPDRRGSLVAALRSEICDGTVLGEQGVGCRCARRSLGEEEG